MLRFLIRLKRGRKRKITKVDKISRPKKVLYQSLRLILPIPVLVKKEKRF